LHYIAPRPDERRERLRYFGFAGAVGFLLLLNLAGVWKTVFGLDTAAILSSDSELLRVLMRGANA
jgi:hypothetical protein